MQPETLQCGLARGVPLILIGVWVRSHAASTGITEMNLCKVKRSHGGIVKGEEQLGVSDSKLACGLHAAGTEANSRSRDK